MLQVARADGAFVIAPDNGGGTATMPPTGEDYTGGQMHIVDGLPVGSPIDILTPLIGAFANVTEVPGGSFAGGTTSQYDALLTLPLNGTGTFAGYVRTVNIPLIAGGGNVMDWDARTGGTSPQSFNADLMNLQGQIIGDPDFDLLRITAGTNFGMPSPGHTTLVDLGGGNWNVDSFFDIAYRIDFVGKPGGPFAGMSGSTNDTARFQMGMRVPEPSTLGLLASGLAGVGLACWRRRRSR